jgi:hypothetical protein
MEPLWTAPLLPDQTGAGHRAIRLLLQAAVGLERQECLADSGHHERVHQAAQHGRDRGCPASTRPTSLPRRRWRHRATPPVVWRLAALSSIARKSGGSGVPNYAATCCTMASTAPLRIARPSGRPVPDIRVSAEKLSPSPRQAPNRRAPNLSQIVRIEQPFGVVSKYEASPAALATSRQSKLDAPEAVTATTGDTSGEPRRLRTRPLGRSIADVARSR